VVLKLHKTNHKVQCSKLKEKKVSLQQNPRFPSLMEGSGVAPFLFFIRHIRVIRVRFLFLIAYGDFQFSPQAIPKNIRKFKIAPCVSESLCLNKKAII
jgi:hypothetical protein